MCKRGIKLHLRCRYLISIGGNVLLNPLYSEMVKDLVLETTVVLRKPEFNCPA